MQASSIIRRFSAFFSQQWNSPGRMAAFSVIARAFAIAAPLPFLYAAFPVEAVAFWLATITFQSLVGAFAGIVPTVAIQMLSYARSGSSSLGGSMEEHAQGRTQGPNWPLIGQVNHVTVRVFAAIAAVWLVFAAVAGTLIVWRPMMASGVVPDAAAAWAIFVAGSAVRLLGQPYAAFGQGMGAVAAVRRKEAVAWLIGGVVAVGILAAIPNLALAMAAIQAPLLLNYVQYRRLARTLGWSAASPDRSSRNHVLSEVWSRSWRGGIGQFAGMLTLYGTGLIFAQVGSGGETAGYLLGLNILGIVGQVAISPVYAAIPALAGRYAEGRRQDMNDLARRVVGRSMRAFVALVLAIPLAVTVLNALLPKPIAFPGGWLWLAMCVSAIVARHGGDHLQYYTTTNDIRWHIVNPVFLILSLGPFLVLPASNPMLLVLVQALAGALFYLPYARWLTATRLDYRLRHELADFLLPLAVMSLGLSAWAIVQQA